MRGRGASALDGWDVCDRRGTQFHWPFVGGFLSWCPRKDSVACRESANKSNNKGRNQEDDVENGACV